MFSLEDDKAVTDLDFADDVALLSGQIKAQGMLEREERAVRESGQHMNAKRQMDRQYWGRYQDQESTSLESLQQTYQNMEVSIAQVNQNKSIYINRGVITIVWLSDLDIH